MFKYIAHTALLYTHNRSCQVRWGHSGRRYPDTRTLRNAIDKMRLMRTQHLFKYQVSNGINGKLLVHTDSYYVLGSGLF